MGTSYRLDELAARVSGEVRGDGATLISSLGMLANAGPGQLSFLGGAAYRQFLSQTGASAVVLTAAEADLCATNCIVVANPRLAFARLSHLFDDKPNPGAGISASAQIDHSVSLGADVSIGSNVVIGPRVQIGARTRISANCVIEADTVIGEDCVLHPNVVLYHRVRMGNRCTLHAGAVLGADGFGFTPDERGHFQAVAQVGSVWMGDDVSIGAATTIDRGAIEDTRIGNGVKIDNQVQVGHNCTIGDHSLLCGCVGLAGSSHIGKHCVLGGGVGVGGNSGPIYITDGVIVSGMTHVSSSIDKPGLYSGGVLFSESKHWKRNAIRFGTLDQLHRRLTKLEKQLLDQQSEK